MSRAVWFVAGAAAGVWGVARARRAAEVFTPDGLRDRSAGLGLGLRLFAEEVRLGAAEKETELRQRLQLAPDGPPRLSAGSHPADHPADPAHEPARPTTRHAAPRLGPRPTDQEDR